MTRLSGFQRVVLLLLLVLSVAALSPWHPAGPFDPRTYARLAHMQLAYPLSSILWEPLTAPGNAIVGAPDFRVAFAVTAFWLGVAAAIWAWRRGGVWWRRGLRTTGWAVFAPWCLIAYMLFISNIHFPGWRLNPHDPDTVIADLHSRTLGTQDASVLGLFKLGWSLARGFNVVAVTAHDDPHGSFSAQQAAAREFPQLGVIPGVEVPDTDGDYLLGLGLKPGVQIPRFSSDRLDYARRFAAAIHDQHHGAVISLGWHLDIDAVHRLAAAGVDGFEIANNIHPDTPKDVRAAILDVAQKDRLALVASSDWHRWGGAVRAWTLFHIPGAAAMTPQQRADAVVAALRNHDAAAVTPVVAGYIGEPSIARIVFAPFVEAVRYGAELSFPRLLGWWVWGGLSIAAAAALERRGLRPSRVLFATWLGIVGIGLLWRGVQIYFSKPQGALALSNTTQQLGGMAMYAAAPLIAVALVLAIIGWRRRRAVTHRDSTPSPDGSTSNN